jgi:acyl-CoA synthetase (AMP-forming)/AMP-acid ligase II
MAETGQSTESAVRNGPARATGPPAPPPGPSGTGPPVNVAAHLEAMAGARPDQRAIVWTAGRGYAHWSYRELNLQTDRLAHGLAAIGITRGLRTILMVRPSPQFFALTFALYKIGAVPVLIDPGMGRRRMVDCLAAVGAEAFIGVGMAHLLRVLHPAAFRSVKFAVTVGRRWGWGGHSLHDLPAGTSRPFDTAPTSPEDPAAIIFTTGSTGPPKGVLYLHGMFDAQVRILREHFGIRPGEIDLPTFPLFALFDPALGMTAVIPDMDPTRPARVDPRRIFRAIRDQQVTHMFGSPALLLRVGSFGRASGVRLPSLRRVISAGAAVPPAVLEAFAALLEPGAIIHTPYGATEALPVASIDHREILGETRRATDEGRGTCVGRPVPGMHVRVLPISDEPIDEWREDRILPAGAIGEFVVQGPVVTREYCTDPRATRLAKIPEAGGPWHRMGDVGWMDERGRLWFCGRKAHRVRTKGGTLFTEPCEAVFNRHPAVRRSALVGVGRPPDQRPVICIETTGRRMDRRRLTAELLALAGRYDVTRAIGTVLYPARFPVDIRHNSKIFREELARWAERRLGRKERSGRRESGSGV